MPIAPCVDEVEGVGDERVHAVLDRRELDDRALGGREVHGLGAPAVGVAALERDALLGHGVEDGPHDVVGAVLVGPGVEHEHPHAPAGLHRDRVVLVLVGDAVEDDEVRGRGRLVGLGVVGGLALGAEVPLALDERELVVDLGQAALGLHDDHAEHAVRDVEEGRRGAAVVHPDAGVVGREGVGERLARLDLHHLVVHRRLAGMEVDGVAHLALVRQVHVDRVAQVHADDGPGHGAAERPGVDDEALRRP